MNHLNGIAILSLRVRPGVPLVRLIPAGRFDAPRGSMAGTGPWNLTAAAAARIIAVNAVRQADILIDYEHQLLASADNGAPAPASGWIDPRSLTYVEAGEEPGLYGVVKWTARAAALIDADEYRYLSPVFPYDPATGEPLDLVHVALTNYPAIDEPVRAALSAALSAPRLARSPLPLNEHHSVDVFNRAFAPLGVLHPDTDRLIGAVGVDRAAYLASVGA